MTDIRTVIFALNQEKDRLESRIKNYEENCGTYSKAKYNSELLQYCLDCRRIIILKRQLSEILNIQKE